MQIRELNVVMRKIDAKYLSHTKSKRVGRFDIRTDEDLSVTIRTKNKYFAIATTQRT